MKYIAPFAPIFTPAGAGLGTLDFSAYAGSFNIANLMAVVDLTTDQTLYLPGVPGLGLAALSANGLIVTLQVNTAAMGAPDALQIFYDDGQGLGTPANNVVADPGASGAVGFLSSLYALSAGKRVAASPGALMRAPQLEDLLRDLIAEVSVTNIILQSAFHVDVDNDVDGGTRAELYELLVN